MIHSLTDRIIKALIFKLPKFALEPLQSSHLCWHRLVGGTDLSSFGFLPFFGAFEAGITGSKHPPSGVNRMILIRVGSFMFFAILETTRPSIIARVAR